MRFVRLTSADTTARADTLRCQNSNSRSADDYSFDGTLIQPPLFTNLLATQSRSADDNQQFHFTNFCINTAESDLPIVLAHVSRSPLAAYHIRYTTERALLNLDELVARLILELA